MPAAPRITSRLITTASIGFIEYSKGFTIAIPFLLALITNIFFKGKIYDHRKT
jgi:hypothetical protein